MIESYIECLKLKAKADFQHQPVRSESFIIHTELKNC